MLLRARRDGPQRPACLPAPFPGRTCSQVVVVPTYNEADCLEPLVDMVLRQERFDLLIIDDNSPDGTGLLAEQLREGAGGKLDVLHRSGRLGMGAALRDGLSYAQARGYERIYQMDADLSHSPLDLPRLAEALEDGADLVLGVRTAPDAAQARRWHRLALRWLGGRYATWLLRLPLSDITSGFRGWRSEVLSRIGLEELHSDSEAFQIETVYRAVLAGAQVVEVPVVSTRRWLGKSKRRGTAAVHALRCVWDLRAASFAEKGERA